MSTFSFSAHSLTSTVVALFAPGTQWSQKPIESLPAACAPRTCGAAMPIDATAVLAKKLRRESLRVSMGVLRLFPAERRRFPFAVELLRLRARTEGKHIA